MGQLPLCASRTCQSMLFQSLCTFRKEVYVTANIFIFPFCILPPRSPFPIMQMPKESLGIMTSEAAHVNSVAVQNGKSSTEVRNYFLKAKGKYLFCIDILDIVKWRWNWEEEPFRGSPVAPRSYHQRTLLPVPKWTTCGQENLWPSLTFPGGASQVQSSDGHQLILDKCVVLNKCRKGSTYIFKINLFTFIQLQLSAFSPHPSIPIVGRGVYRSYHKGHKDKIKGECRGGGGRWDCLGWGGGMGRKCRQS